MRKQKWLDLLSGDPRSWLLASEEPAARWLTLTRLFDRDERDPDVRKARADLLADGATRELVDRIPRWDSPIQAWGHNSPKFPPNLFQLLADMGVRGGDFERLEGILDCMLDHQDDNGRFTSLSKAPGSSGRAVWGTLLCDTHAVTEVLVRFGRESHPRTREAIARMRDDLATTAQGRAWPCIPHSVTGWRGPGRKADYCPQVTLEALRTFSRLPSGKRPKGLLDVARLHLRTWQSRGEHKPYMFGHGAGFKIVKWPATWYSTYWVLDTLGRYPRLWQGKTARPEDRQALAELLACLVAYNFSADGRVTPQSCYQGFAKYSFGQKKRPSPFATAQLAVVLRTFEDLAQQAAEVDVLALSSSKGGMGTPVAPKV